MSLKVDKVQLEIILKADTARAEMMKLDDEAKSITKSMKKMKEGSQEWIQANDKLSAVKAKWNELNNSIQLTNKTMKELQDRAKVLNMQMRNMDPNTAKYKEYRAELNQINSRMRELRGTAASTQSSFSSLANGFNKYFAIVTAGIAAFTGLTMSVKKFMDARNELEDRQANLQSLTGLGDNDVQWLTDQAKKLSSQATDTGVKIRASAQDIVDGFTKMGSKRPELLKNKEALLEVTTAALTLATAGKMEAEPAFTAMAAAMNQFDLGADQSTRVINVLGAGALAGSAEISDLSDSLKNVGAVANGSNMSLEQTVGALEVLAEKQLLGEEAGTKLRGALLKMKSAGEGYASGSFVLRDALAEISAKLKGMGSDMERDAFMQKTFGLENQTAGQILLANIPKYDQYTKAVTGTNVAMEQAAINSKTVAATLEQAQNAFLNAGMELVKNLTPALISATNVTRNFIKLLIALPGWLKENAATLIGLVSALTAFLVVTNLQTIALKLMYIWDKAVELGNAVKILALRIRIALTKEATAAEMALAEATAASNTAMKGNLWGLLAAAIAFALVYLIDWIKKTTELTDAQKIQVAIMDDYKEAYKQNSEAIFKQRSELTSLVTAIINTNNNEQTRSRLIDELNQKYQGFISFIDKEKVSNELLASALADVNEQYDMKLKSISLNSKAQAYENAAVKAMQRQIEIQDELNKLRSEPGNHDKKIKALQDEDAQLNKNIKLYETASYTFRANAAKNNQEIQAMNTSEYYSNQMDQYKNFLKEVSKKRDEYEGGTEKWNFYNDQIKQANAAFKYANLKYNEIKKLEDEAKKPNSGGDTTTTPTTEPDAELKKQLAAKEKAYKESQLELMEQRRKGELTEEVYNKIALQTQLTFLEDKKKLQKEYGKETLDTEIEISNQKSKIQKDGDESAVKSIKEIQDAGMQVLSDAQLKKETMLQDALNAGIITEKQYNYEMKKLAFEAAETKLKLAETTYEALSKITFKDTELQKKTLEDAKKEIEKLKLDLAKARGEVVKEGANIAEKEAKTIDEQMQQIFGNSFSNIGKLFGDFYKGLDKLKKGDLKSWTDWAVAIGETVQAALAVATEINDEYFATKAASLEADKQRELTNAGDNAEAREAINRKYAQKELDLKKQQSSSDTMLKVAQAVAAGGLAIVQAFAQLGPIGGAIAAVLVGGITALQVQTILKQNAAIQATTLESTPSSGTSAVSTGALVANQAADGRYDVVGAQDGRRYNGVRYAGRATTGVVTTPTLMGEAGTELIIDAPTLNRLNLKAPNFIPWVFANRVQQRADGKYDTAQNNTNIVGADNSQLIAANIAVMNRLTGLLDSIERNGVKAPIVLSELEAKQALRDKSLKKGSL